MKLIIRGTLHCIVSARQTCRENKVSNKTRVLWKFHEIVGRAVCTAPPTKAANIGLRSLNAFAMWSIQKDGVFLDFCCNSEKHNIFRIGILFAFWVIASKCKNFFGNYFSISLIKQKKFKLPLSHWILHIPRNIFWRLFGVGEICNDEFGYFPNPVNFFNVLLPWQNVVWHTKKNPFNSLLTVVTNLR